MAGDAAFVMVPPGFDTLAMLTRLVVVAAVWTVLSNNARVGFRLRLIWLDWCVIWNLLLTIHILYFEPVLRALGVFSIFGSWKGFRQEHYPVSLVCLLRRDAP